MHNRISLAHNSYWFPPRSNLCKLNFDAGISMENSSTGWGMVARHSSGNFAETKAKTISGCMDLHGAELLAAKEGLLFAWD